jgi:ring-1,2-phenylacetyl-CoA epoxidase subunit PaaE
MVQLSLEELGYETEQIKKEIFDTTKPARKLAPPDKDRHRVIIHLEDKTVSFPAQFPYTVLQAARKNNIVLPYSCETGRCASCLMTCTKGKVWMSYNEVLTNKDIAAGKVLTCVGHPIGGDVELRFPDRETRLG